MITKTDFKEYLKSPAHLWAMKKGKIEVGPSPLALHLMEGGREIEKLAQQYLQKHQLKENGAETSFEETFLDGNFQARADVIARYPDEGVLDIYEIKSASSVRKEDIYDAAFQRLVVEASENVRGVYLVHLNKDYIRQGKLNLDELFLSVNVDEEVEAILEEVRVSREMAWEVTLQETPDEIDTCLNPKDCPCPSICHPDLPDFPIYDLPYLSRNKKLDLKSQGIISIYDIPADFNLSDNQALHRQAVNKGSPLIDLGSIQEELDLLEYPLNFLDYETYNPGIPIFDGYHPWEHIVYQYSLHIQSGPGGKIEHHELLLTGEGDPGPELVRTLAEVLPGTGSVIVWYKPFESSRNTEMAERYPAYRDFLIGVNDRIYDLMEVFRKGYYVDQGFKGSASIKNVLPVFLPEFEGEYEKMEISHGEGAMLAWAGIQSGEIPLNQVGDVRNNMLAYCKLDTLAMVKIWERLWEIVEKGK
jgi:hypothetical protein